MSDAVYEQAQEEIRAEEMRRGAEAKQILDHPLLKDVCSRLEKDYLSQSLDANTVEGREEARHNILALRRVLAGIRAEFEQGQRARTEQDRAEKRRQATPPVRAPQRGR